MEKRTAGVIETVEGDWVEIYPQDETIIEDPVLAWLCDARPLTWWERFYVGAALWRDGQAKYPWFVKQTNKDQWIEDPDTE